MATQICNNDSVVFGQKSKGFYQSFFRGRKIACRSKAAKGIAVKKPLIISSPNNEKKRKSESCCASKDDGSKKRRVRESESCCATKDDGSKKRRVDDYEGLGMIGKGKYGVVYKVREKETGIIMAMKEEIDSLCETTLMETDIFKSLGRHPSIVGFEGVAVDEYDGVYVMMEYMESDLRSYIKKEKGLAINEVKELMKQLLEGVKFLHENGVMHRDLKPENILVSEDGDLKICDFGMAARFGETKGSYSSRVGTLWYRAPELLLGETEYSSEVDMWSVGCIMAELVLNKVLFRGNNEEYQLHEIYSILGHPKYAKNLSSSISSANLVLNEDGFDLLKRLLSYDTSERMTAASALDHAWFDDED